MDSIVCGAPKAKDVKASRVLATHYCFPRKGVYPVPKTTTETIPLLSVYYVCSGISKCNYQSVPVRLAC